MKIPDILSSVQPSVSFEVFPPKQNAAFEPIVAAVDRLCDLKPAFISVTYGAGGGANTNTRAIAEHIVRRGVTPLAHLTCLTSTREKIQEELAALRNAGVRNILALRGDLPEGRKDTGGDFQYGVQLLRYLHEKYPEMDLYAPAYPEGHIEDTEYGKAKHILLEKALYARMCITQMCLTKQVMNEFAFFCSLRNYIGIMPLTDKDRIFKMCAKNGIEMPRELMRLMGRYDGEDFRKAGLDYTVGLAKNAMELKSYGIQIFSMNDADAVEQIVRGGKIVRIRRKRFLPQ